MRGFKIIASELLRLIFVFIVSEDISLRLLN